MARSGTLCVLVVLGVCLGIVSGAKDDSKWSEKDIQETLFSSKSSPPFPDLSIKCHPPPHHKPNPSPALSPVDDAVPPSHTASPTQPPNSALSPVAVPPSHVAPSPVDAVPPTHTSPTHSPHVSPSPVVPPPRTTPAASSPHKAPSSPSPAPSAKAVPPAHVAPITPPPSQSPVVDPPPSRPHPPPSCPPPTCPPPPPSTDCSLVLINVEGCVSELITFFFKPYKASISTQCCKTVSTISDNCFYSGFTHFRAPFFLGKVRHYCAHHQA